MDVSKVKIDNKAPTALYFKEFHELKDPTAYYYRAGSSASRIEPEDLDEECRQVLLDLISKVDIVLPRISECEFLFGETNPEKACAKLLSTGDGFDAGFISGILNNLGIKECGRLANDVGAFVTTVRGGFEGLPTLREIKEFRWELNIIDR